MAGSTKTLSKKDSDELIKTLKTRFDKHMHRHPHFQWDAIQERLESNPTKLWSLNAMEETGGEPDVVGRDEKTGEFIFFDCAAESPGGRRSICYDDEALAARKEHKPADSAINMAKEMGIGILNEEQYRALQQLGKFDSKTSSWIETPAAIRKLGGALFCDYRYATVFVYHNGAESYYAARGFRGSIKI